MVPLLVGMIIRVFQLLVLVLACLGLAAYGLGLAKMVLFTSLTRGAANIHTVAAMFSYQYAYAKSLYGALCSSVDGCK